MADTGTVGEKKGRSSGFLTMFFIDTIVKTPGLTIVLTVLGAVPVFVQVCLALEMMLAALKSLGIVHV